MSGTNEAVEQTNSGMRLSFTRQLAILIVLSRAKETGITLQAIFQSLSRATAETHEGKIWAAAAKEIPSKEFAAVLSDTGLFSRDIKLILDVFREDSGLPAAIEYLKVVCPPVDRGAYNYE
ncbi:MULTISPECIES: hypothetical protein [Pseudomonas]|jgi:DNA-binding transcriptional MerR regulator|uniref:Uncharacterized protein n=1 Tax=Pseudomonas fluorescens TaxID=294 RepID=A0A166QRC1_PSEFL|nr:MULTISPECIES: hypothetical protein [Pseudomonas]KZN20734.1 hypothetical protein A1D17_04105 [Pseudomonas fluorescens]